GRRIVYTTWGNGTDAGVPEGNLWIVDARPNSTPRQIGRGMLPQWSPDGEHLAYYTPGPGNRQLWVMDVRTGKSRQITQLKDGIQISQYTFFDGWWFDPLWYSWSPDGTKLAFTSLIAKEEAKSGMAPPANDKPLGADPKQGLPLILNSTTPYAWTMHGVFAATEGSTRDPSAKVDPWKAGQIFIADVNTGQVEQLTHGDDNYFNPQWSPDGKSIVCASTEGSLNWSDFKRTNLYVFGVDSKAKRAVTAGDGIKRLPSWSPDGKWIAYAGAESLSGTRHIYVISVKGTDSPKNLTNQFGGPVTLEQSFSHFVWTPDSRSIVINRKNGLAKIDISDLHSTPIVSPGGVINDETVSMSRSGILVWEKMDERNWGLIEMVDGNSTSPSLVVDTNPQMKEWAIGEQELVQWKNSRGDQLEGVLIKPAGYKQGHKYPLIVDCYPAVLQEHEFSVSEMGGNQAFASRGYAVFFPVTRAPHVWQTVVKSEAFMQAVKGPDGWAVMVDDIMSGVDELIRRGIVDPDRMGLTGFSNGGGVADYLVTATTRFKCAVSIAAVAPDWLSEFFFPAGGGPPAATLLWYGKDSTPWT
ncbi:MAG TPA: DPP IV N-terminal domain-containing protein, partial [Terriglobales bacterium]|nr:DPP IV N-terminal domain-containing protein [Terriglobales bacterium]